MKGKVKLDIKGLREFTKKVNELSEQGVRDTMHDSEEDVLDKYLECVKSVTPVKTGKLKDGWKKSRAPLIKGSTPIYKSKVKNDVFYARFVEYGKYDKENDIFIAKAQNMKQKARKMVEREMSGIERKRLDEFGKKFK